MGPSLARLSFSGLSYKGRLKLMLGHLALTCQNVTDMNDQIVAMLQDIGLNSTEAQIYYAGHISDISLPASSLQKLTGIKRPTVYNALRTLEEKGLVAKGSKDKKTVFTFAAPTMLRKFLKDELDQARKSLQLSEIVIDALYGLNQPIGRAGLLNTPDGILSHLQVMSLSSDSTAYIVVCEPMSPDLTVIVESLLSLLSAGGRLAVVLASPEAGFVLPRTEGVVPLNLCNNPINLVKGVVIASDNVVTTIVQEPQLQAEVVESRGYAEVISGLCQQAVNNVN